MQKNYLINGPVSKSLIAYLLDEMSQKSDTGGHSFFLGQVRADKIGRKTVREIEYSAYESMVTSEADKIIKTVLGEYNDVKFIAIVHSTGVVKAGEFSLLVTVSAGHRKQAMEACARTVEMIKRELPVWKKEIYEDDSHNWK
jgi:molybdopterin synthase catalytic subunit